MNFGKNREKFYYTNYNCPGVQKYEYACGMLNCRTAYTYYKHCSYMAVQQCDNTSDISTPSTPAVPNCCYPKG